MSKKILEGIVLSNSSNKTIKVLVERKVLHKRYKKIIKRSKKLLVHDEENSASIGDKIMIIESRPISKLKRWNILKTEV